MSRGHSGYRLKDNFNKPRGKSGWGLQGVGQIPLKKKRDEGTATQIHGLHQCLKGAGQSKKARASKEKSRQKKITRTLLLN